MIMKTRDLRVAQKLEVGGISYLIFLPHLGYAHLYNISI